VLRLTAPYSLVEVQKYAQVPPGQILLLPSPDSEAPDDLFPQHVIEGEADSVEQIPCLDEGLLQTWENIRNQVGKLGLTDIQVARWFNQIYRIEVNLADFSSNIPPEKFTPEMLSRFCDSLAVYEDRLRQKLAKN